LDCCFVSFEKISTPADLNHPGSSLVFGEPDKNLDQQFGNIARLSGAAGKREEK